MKEELYKTLYEKEKRKNRILSKIPPPKKATFAEVKAYWDKRVLAEFV